MDAFPSWVASWPNPRNPPTTLRPQHCPKILKVTEACESPSLREPLLLPPAPTLTPLCAASLGAALAASETPSGS